MVPLAEYPVVKSNDPLKKAVLRLSKEYLDPSAGISHRTILVVDKDQNLVGILDFRTILETLVPRGLWGFLDELSTVGTAAAMAEGGLDDVAAYKKQFYEAVLKGADTPIRDVMLKIRGTVQADDDLLKALRIKIKNKLTVLPVYHGEKLIGVLSDIDLFLSAAEVLKPFEDAR